MGYDRNKVIQIAQNEVGYLEKSKSAYLKYGTPILYEKTKGAGYDNYTKYGYEMHKLYPSVMDFPAAWCDLFNDWCFYKAYGIATAKSLLGCNFDDYTVASAQMYQKKNALDHTPEAGAQVFFTKNGQASGCYHTGLVIAVSADKRTITTIEGNTSATGSGIVANGGCVARKTRTVNNNTLFGHPNYADANGSLAKKNEVKKMAQYAGIVTVSDYLNVRTGAGTNQPNVMLGGSPFRLPNGMPVSIESESNGWGKLTGVNGWVSLQYIKR